MMKPLLAWLIFSLMMFAGYSQTITQATVNGSTWLIDSVIVDIPGSEGKPKELNEIKKGFTKARLIFNRDTTFDIKYAPGEPTSSFFKDLFHTSRPDGPLKWKFDESTASLAIGTPKDNYTIMVIQIITKGEDIYFSMEDFGRLELRVRKL
jgi:hypothetical protein